MMIVFILIIILSAVIFYMMRDRDAAKLKKANRAAKRAEANK